MNKVYIVAAKRSPIGKFLGSLAAVKPGDLAAQVMKQVIKDAQFDAAKIDEIFIGHQHSAGQGPSIARRAQLEAGIPVEVPATTVNMQCGSGMKALILGYNSIQAGADIVLCGGVENMSQVPFILTNKARKGVKMGNTAIDVQDSLFCDGLIDQFNGYLMGVTAENVAEKIGVSREEQDIFAVCSQNRAQQAIESGRFADEIVPIKHAGKKGVEMVFATDESHTPGTTLAGLQKLKPAFKKEGTVTAGNASQLNDGSAAIILASEKAVIENGWQPLAEIISSATVGIDPAIMGLGPVKAIIKTLAAAKMNFEQVELVELNEAFAAQSLGCVKELAKQYNVTEKSILEKTNVNGGAIALGHPVASSGTRIVVSLIYEMQRTNRKYGLASLCVGGGMGTAMLIKV
ncbi:acetyl-CoA C-acyltransferase [Sporomusa termitida]|uniref:acetyl-CoA C-acetyltransferase n=1 Tax=Sporomusa termitida TaxID=2377 RepID=A0A517DWW6_9FIRM|nr:acetyl-CoA C-acyltransferase [Sporomusa termitida]QDR81823.1 Acetyl-CoA acetyltransferase [Sporomusa termitida]